MPGTPISPRPAPADQAASSAADRVMWPLYAAGFTTAFGAHGVAANLAGFNRSTGGTLLTLGILLAVYDGAEIVFKPVFGALADRIGPRPVLLGGLVAFALFSAAFVAAGNPAGVALARFGQGIAASAFSPAASMLVARLTPAARHGGVFGSYGAYKSLGYTLGPVLGGALVFTGGFRLLFGVLAVLAAAVAVWSAVVLPAAAPLPKTRQTLLGLLRALSRPAFVQPTIALAATTAALAVGVGFLPVRGAAAGLGPLATGAAVSLLALTSTVAQPLIGRARDVGRIASAAGIIAGLAVTTAGLAVAALVPGIAGLLTGAVCIGGGVGIVTPLGFTALAASTPPARLGTTMGAAEVGREAGDAGGPLLVGAVAASATLPVGLLALAGLLAAATIGAAVHHRTPGRTGHG